MSYLLQFTSVEDPKDAQLWIQRLDGACTGEPETWQIDLTEALHFVR